MSYGRLEIYFNTIDVIAEFTTLSSGIEVILQGPTIEIKEERIDVDVTTPILVGGVLLDVIDGGEW